MSLAACGVVGPGGTADEAVTLEPARTDGGVWSTTIELPATEIAGSPVVALAADTDEVVCADGSALPPGGVPIGTELDLA